MKHLRRFNEKLETDNYRSIFDDIDNDIMEMSEDEALEYLDEIINYCINKKLEGYSE
jgi:predicted HAD superfamily phosphohydrolase YqeG